MLVVARVFLVLLVLSVGACGRREENASASPESALQSFLSALRAGDADRTWAFLGPRTREELMRLSKQAESIGVSGPPAALVRAASVPGPADIATIERVGELNETGVRLRIVTHHGHTSELDVLRSGGGWSFELGGRAVGAAPSTL